MRVANAAAILADSSSSFTVCACVFWKCSQSDLAAARKVMLEIEALREVMNIAESTPMVMFRLPLRLSRGATE